jgi:hypothetical protein
LTSYELDVSSDPEEEWQAATPPNNEDVIKLKNVIK